MVLTISLLCFYYVSVYKNFYLLYLFNAHNYLVRNLNQCVSKIHVVNNYAHLLGLNFKSWENSESSQIACSIAWIISFPWSIIGPCNVYKIYGLHFAKVSLLSRLTKPCLSNVLVPWEHPRRKRARKREDRGERKRWSNAERKQVSVGKMLNHQSNSVSQLTMMPAPQNEKRPA